MEDNDKNIVDHSRSASYAARDDGTDNPGTYELPLPREVFRYAVLGALFGLCFPIGSMVFLLLTEVPHHGDLFASVRECHRNSLLYVIDTAPLFLGIFAAFAGVRQDRIIRFSHDLEKEVREKTESLRLALREAEMANETIAYMADHDALTGLLNRRRFEANLECGISMARRHDRPLSLLFIDLDNFKPINDCYGHAAGDDYLVRVATLLTEAARCSDCVTRVGGDEFAVILPETGDSQAVVVVEKIFDLFRKSPLIIQGTIVGISVCIGIATFPHDAATAEDLMTCADRAMYEAKKRKKNCWVSFRDFLNSKGS